MQLNLYRMDWIKEMDYKRYLSGDLRELEEIVGIDLLIKILVYFAKTTIYFSEKPIMEMKQEYIRQHYNKCTVKELAKKLNVSERLVYKIGTQKYINKNQVNLFDE